MNRKPPAKVSANSLISLAIVEGAAKAAAAWLPFLPKRQD